MKQSTESKELRKFLAESGCLKTDGNHCFLMMNDGIAVHNVKTKAVVVLSWNKLKTYIAEDAEFEEIF